MGALTALLHVATSALSADQSALTATASNIANQNTVGYTRRSVEWNEGDLVTVTGQAVGVRATVTAQRDTVLQRSVQQATEAASASNTRYTALNALQGFFAIDSTGVDASGIGAAISGFFNAATALASTPGDTLARQAMFTASQSLAAAFNRTGAQISGQAAGLDRQVTTSVVQVNTLAAQVASLNRQLSEAPTDGEQDALIDARDRAVTQIAQLVGVNPITGTHGSIDLALPDGTPLVSGPNAYQLTTATVAGKVRVFAGTGAGGEDVTSVIQGGSVGGALAARDTDLAGATAQLDTLASALAAAVNVQNAAGTTASGAVGDRIFSGNTAGSLTVIAASGNDFATTGGDGKANSNALALSNLQNAGVVNNTTPVVAFSQFISALGAQASNAKTQSTADTAVLTQTQTQMDALSGVSLDVEGSNLTQYQRSYQAAAKVLAIVNTLLAQAINLGQQTSVS